MKTASSIRIFLLLVISWNGFAQVTQKQDTLLVKGQISSWLNINMDNKMPLWLGGRYIPQANYTLQFPKNKLIDFEGSLNISGQAGFHPFDSATADGSIRPYRIFGRYSAKQFETRIGLQKINFGSATMLRPLMWFDQVDPRDPLQLTNGVWGILGRYYFLNNANIWLWGLYGNDRPKTWEIAKTSQKYPELGGRFQSPVPKGEAAITYHFRMADMGEFVNAEMEQVPENRIGLDAKWDIGIGVWVEGVWIHKSKNVGAFTNQELITVGADYTFGWGNGVNVVYEQFLSSYDERVFAFSNSITMSAVSLSYPLGMFDNLSSIVYYDWMNKKAYNFVNWKHQFKKFFIYTMAYWNPVNSQLPQQGVAGNIYAGKGIQVMLVYNH
ncbi:hypothetical protein Q0590_09565 [Rhodocytophaga aerolata]|uniref:Porin n=1 Tax=Rhodocytophaga aerolata TaxID=455078 RepID=A0ABT8R315_9BACT|nr:hypothetical protein [Rhodocytophaga aerolata]MDO1446496.1 hypothetical protein [Rhodocytophaga aerolata]